MDWHVTVDGAAPDANPVAKDKAAPALKDVAGTAADGSSFMSFDIRKTSQSAAEAAIASLGDDGDSTAVSAAAAPPVTAAAAPSEDDALMDAILSEVGM